MNIDTILDGESTQLVNLNNLLENNSPIIVFGTGNLGKKVLQVLLDKGKPILALADNNIGKWNTEISGIKIWPPAELDKTLLNSAIVIVAIWSPGHSYKETKAQIESLGAKHIFNIATLAQIFPDELLPNYHFESAAYFRAHRQELQEAYNLFADDESKRQFLAQLDSRVTQNFEGLPEADVENQYFTDIVSLSDDEVFLDAGAYIGDTMSDFLKHHPRFRKYIALEPDPQNFDKLTANVSVSPLAANVKLYKYAVGVENCTLKFEATGGGGAAINSNGLIEVECKRIDDYFFDEELTYLKFDIEGAELDALKGAHQTILKQKPKLAVCIYHLPDDLWQIPFYIKNNFPFYKLYARTHQFDGLDFVLYAIPQ